MPSIYDSSHELLCRVMPNLASQLRQPLGNIYSALQRLMDQPAADREKRDQDLAVLYQSYYRLLRLVGNLSDAPTLLSDDPLPLANDDIVAFVHEICRRAEVPAELCGQRVIFESEKAVHVMAFNAAGMERLLLNLLSNAMKFTGRGGVITVALRLRRDTVELSVEDTGPGLDPAEQDVLFDRYQHPDLLDPSPHGFGLGLPLCRRVAQAHGGTILLSGVPHAGTRVTVSLPNRRVDRSQLREMGFDYAGGFNHMPLELSDALPYTAFTHQNLD